ncbi:proteoglycan 4-like [Salvelinus sp. IW2-2015]|uniref:proteoglycan 4-like n=1 Tax=Salvelinus sp. IW2-2015 TaxID=2691554 RepID=UPI0038D36D1E
MGLSAGIRHRPAEQRDSPKRSTPQPPGREDRPNTEPEEQTPQDPPGQTTPPGPEHSPGHTGHHPEGAERGMTRTQTAPGEQTDSPEHPHIPGHSNSPKHNTPPGHTRATRAPITTPEARHETPKQHSADRRHTPEHNTSPKRDTSRGKPDKSAPRTTTRANTGPTPRRPNTCPQNHPTNIHPGQGNTAHGTTAPGTDRHGAPTNKHTNAAGASSKHRGAGNTSTDPATGSRTVPERKSRASPAVRDQPRKATNQRQAPGQQQSPRSKTQPRQEQHTSDPPGNTRRRQTTRTRHEAANTTQTPSAPKTQDAAAERPEKDRRDPRNADSTPQRGPQKSENDPRKEARETRDHHLFRTAALAHSHLPDTTPTDASSPILDHSRAHPTLPLFTHRCNTSISAWRRLHAFIILERRCSLPGSIASILLGNTAETPNRTRPHRKSDHRRRTTAGRGSPQDGRGPDPRRAAQDGGASGRSRHRNRDGTRLGRSSRNERTLRPARQHQGNKGTPRGG